MSVDTQVDPLGRLIAAIAAGDVDAAREAYAPDARIWHNTELREQSVDENVRVLRWVMRNIADLRYEDVRRAASPDLAILEFLETTYRASATLAGWDMDAFDGPLLRAS